MSYPLRVVSMLRVVLSSETETFCILAVHFQLTRQHKKPNIVRLISVCASVVYLSLKQESKKNCEILPRSACILRSMPSPMLIKIMSPLAKGRLYPIWSVDPLDAFKVWGFLVNPNFPCIRYALTSVCLKDHAGTD